MTFALIALAVLLAVVKLLHIIARASMRRQRIKIAREEAERRLHERKDLSL